MSAQRHPTASWLLPTAEIRSSPIEGKGLYATTDIPAGTVVMRLGGALIDDMALAALTPPYSSLTVEPGGHLLLDPAHPVRYGNHSCDPTLWHADATTLTARRPLSPGEELTVDYATHTGYEPWTMTCRCGTTACRDTITGADWRLPNLQHAYAGHWSPPLRDRIRALANGDGR
ncbi:SET domain-containing protein [Streptomyces sp. NPDC048669]|uniref:SET domain-containing protein n=1 Tax=Streptomyces sp. NPDC048669 TaxID=3155267 RepID=UPI0034255EC6